MEKHRILTISLFFSFSFFLLSCTNTDKNINVDSFVETDSSTIDSQQNLTIDTEKVYICDSETAKKYHYSKTCRGLSKCKHEIVEIRLTEAKNRGKTLCGWED